MMKIKSASWMIIVFISLFSIASISLIVESSELEKKIQVEVTGEAIIGTDKQLAKATALKDAFRNALEKALGTRITTATIMEELTITSDLVISQSWGHILAYQNIKEWESEEKYYVQITAEVSSDARWWTEFTNSLNLPRLQIKDLALTKTYSYDDLILPGGLYHDKVLIIPTKGTSYKLVAIHTESLQIVWEQRISSRLTTPLINVGEWVIAIANREVTVYNLYYGWIKWKYDLKEAISQAPLIYDEQIYLTTQRGNLYVLSLKKGKMTWKYKTQSYFLSEPTVAGDRLYFTDTQGYLYALDISRQSQAFKILINPKLQAAPTPTKVLTYLAWNDGRDIIQALDSLDGSYLWQVKGEVSKATSILKPRLLNERVLAIFVHQDHSQIYLLDSKTGYQYWTKELSETVVQIVAVTNELIVLNTWEGIRILNLDGHLLWENGATGLKTQIILGENSLYYLYDHQLEVYN